MQISLFRSNDLAEQAAISIAKLIEKAFFSGLVFASNPIKNAMEEASIPAASYRIQCRGIQFSVFLYLTAAAVCLCMILLVLVFTIPEYGSWRFHAPVNQLYEDMDSFFIGVCCLILCSGFFLLSVCGIVRLFRKSGRAPSPLWRRSRNYILFISFILVAVSMLWDRDVTAKMDAIIEDGKNPQTVPPKDGRYRFRLWT